MRVRVARESRPGVADDGDEKYDKHEEVTVIEPCEVVQHPLAEPCFLRQPFHGLVLGLVIALIGHTSVGMGR